MTSYTIDKSFTSRVERTPRVLEVAEAFGLGLNDKRFPIYENLILEVEPGDVVYINGQSGSGKSLLLNMLADQMRAQGLKVADLNTVELPDMPVIECVGKDTHDAMNWLSRAGISDAWIYIRKPSELSDGQRYRLKLAKVLESGADVWIADEFGAILDRVTAKVIAFNCQKTARATGKTLIVATTHTDMTEELGPSLLIFKRFRERVDIIQGGPAGD